MFLQRFAHPDGRARLAAIRPGRNPAPVPGQLILTTGRVMEHYQTGTQTRRVAALLEAHPEASVAVHPASAGEHGLRDGDQALISNAQGEMTARVVFDDGMRTDTIFAPFHHPGKGAANLLTQALTDPHSHMPEFKNTPVTIRPTSESDPSKETPL